MLILIIIGRRVSTSQWWHFSTLLSTIKFLIVLRKLFRSTLWAKVEKFNDNVAPRGTHCENYWRKISTTGTELSNSTRASFPSIMWRRSSCWSKKVLVCLAGCLGELGRVLFEHERWRTMECEEESRISSLLYFYGESQRSTSISLGLISFCGFTLKTVSSLLFDSMMLGLIFHTRRLAFSYLLAAKRRTFSNSHFVTCMPRSLWHLKYKFLFVPLMEKEERKEELRSIK